MVIINNVDFTLMSLIIGIFGMFLILLAFILEEFSKKFNNTAIWYNLLNFIGSGMMIVYAINLRGWPFLILNTVWLSVAGYKLILKLMILLKK